MKQVPSERSSIAWFKLAEVIGRGERERAFSLFRLLIHSFDDQAFSKKLEADIWVSFDIQEAESHYKESAHLYKQDEKWMQALGIYELLVHYCPDSVHYYEQVIELCDALKFQDKKLLAQKDICKLFLEQGQIEKALDLFVLFEKDLKEVDVFAFHQKIIIAALHHKYTKQVVLNLYLKKALDGLFRASSESEIKEFLAKIRALSFAWHKDAVTYLEEQGYN